MVPNKNKKHVDNDVLIKFAILKDTEELIFDQLCYNGEKYGKLLF